VYKPPKTDFTFEKPINFENCHTKIVFGDFHSHSTILRYLENDQNRKNMKNRAKAKGLFLIYDPNFRGLSIAADGKKAIT